MEGDESMRRIALLLMVMASTLLVASGVAWAVTKTCPPVPKKCLGTSGADVLKSSSSKNWMYGKGGNDTYTHFVRGNSGNDGIIDSGGKDHLLLLNYTKSEVKFRWFDINENGNADALGIYLGKGSKNTVMIYNAYDDTKSKAPFPHGRGWIEDIRCCGTQTSHVPPNVGIKTPK
jgi:RTX calcium-binding nonapeptide repeat (4 copies)